MNTKLDCPSSLSKLSQLKPVSVLGVPYFDQVIALSEVGYVQAHSPASALKMIQSGRADYGVGSERHLSRFELTSSVKLERCFEEPQLNVTSHTLKHCRHANKIKVLETGIRQTLAERNSQFDSNSSDKLTL